MSKRFRFGWYGDGGMGEKMISSVLAGRKTATACPAYDPEDAELRDGDELQLVDKHGALRAQLVVTAVELRAFAAVDQALADCVGVTLPEFRQKMDFANGRKVRDDEQIRVVHFRVVKDTVAAGKK